MNQRKATSSRFIKLVFILPAVLAFAISSNVQALQLKDVQASQNLLNAEDSVYTFAEKMPEFPGGEKALVSFLSQNISFPAEAMKRNEHGKVYVQFVVNKTGKVENPKVLKSVSADLDNEALRVIGLLPNWTPGEQSGEKVAVQRIIPIMFQNTVPNDTNTWEPNTKTLVLIDDVKMPVGFNSGILNLDKMASASLLKPFPEKEKSKLMSKYGKQAADGVILITSKKTEIEFAPADTSSNKLKADTTGCKATTIMPEFPGGEAKLMSYIADSIQYPFAAKQLKTQGKVFVQFMVDKAGKVSDAKTVRRFDYFLDKEAVRVVSTMPDWSPGTKCGEKTDMYVVIPVTFKLETPDAKKTWERNKKTIILLDGERLPASFNLDWINYAALSSYQVLQPSSKEVIKKLVSQYGRDAANGVVLISSAKQ
jgi:TonB family protein